ncbi:MotE family protein [Sulfitobacter sabulilitoris]|uniref:Magnesium transporter MgtE intracellular domain-containing protein n=1 Tax=Sulfitobacter sabulilitoris TaxID=2562655 RepID=A0A5S3PJY2_9RHOB|nr:hypothetical protein [Sulfitobacter sabulilitoris]TMM52496.1 hypothetical protein FDT80_09455 [Sulfitobacter sabulilitoris]
MGKASKTRRRRSGRGTVLLIAALLMGSAALRVGAGAGPAFAKDALLPAQTDMDMATAASPSSPGDMQAMLQAFQQREARILEREKRMEIRLKALSVADQEIEKRLASLQSAEAALRATLALADSAAEDDLARLTTVYESMKPKDAAALFEAMEPEFAAGFLGRMRADAAAGIMAGLSPTSAYTISVILAGRNANVPKG